MPSFLELLSPLFPRAVRLRGEEYLREGRVTLTRVEDRRVEARVAGTTGYRVSVEVGADEEVGLDCDCPFFEDVGACKHLWATLLDIDRKGLLPRSAAAGPSDEDAERDLADDPHELPAGPTPVAPPLVLTAQPSPQPTAVWRRRLREILNRSPLPRTPAPSLVPATTVPANEAVATQRIVYLLDVAATMAYQSGLALQVCMERRRRDGAWGTPRSLSVGAPAWSALAQPADEEIAQMLIGAGPATGYFGSPVSGGSSRFTLSGRAPRLLLPRLCATGRARVLLDPAQKNGSALGWDDGPPWELVLSLEPAKDGQLVRLTAAFRRGGHAVHSGAPHVVLSDGIAISERDPFGELSDTPLLAAELDHHDAFPLLAELRRGTALEIEADEVDALLAELCAFPRIPPLELSPALGMDDISVPPIPVLALTLPPAERGWQEVEGLLRFDYDGVSIGWDDGGDASFDGERRRVVRRDRRAEGAARDRLTSLGIHEGIDYRTGGRGLRLAPGKLPAAMARLAEEGWRLELSGRAVRSADETSIDVSSGIDWFELRVSVDYGGVHADLPRLLAALRRGETTVLLDDGSLGVIPDAWARRLETIASLGKSGEGRVRFGLAQAGLLDALLAAEPEARTDETFTRIRDQLHGFEGITPLEAPAGFLGQLRPYQCEGLGWLEFLRRFGVGGCLADDMGLGKTVQVLAMLERRRQENAGPSLVVVPRSLVFNWRLEATHFTPALRVLDHSGTKRTRDTERFAEHDLVLTTYGTLRRDAALFRDVTFEYVILDEANAIKNAGTQAAKAARLLRARHRLALTGTPVENRLGELWSLLEFLNPGMLGAASVFRTLADTSDGSSRSLIGRAVRPFILRRTKEQVARDLPTRQEQTVYVELSAEERSLYDELRDHYRAALRARVEQVGVGRSRIQILEALLRLRQAACHPGLIDETRRTESSSKLDVLAPQLAEVAESGHKALVFSQFTSFLALVRARLDAEGITYEYLDGRTRDRESRVARFQSDPACPVFLISLKAGGVGLNLTAADYVFLLDPWWNPAVEAQAIDRTHRIGQTRHVLASRLIARDTVEERVLELQAAKRALADAIIGEDNAVLSRMGRDELDLLLS